MQLTDAIMAALALGGTSLAAEHMVMVGKTDITFVPPVTTAAKGDTVTFKFYSEHNVIQSEEDTPCMPMDGGFFSTTIDPEKANKEFTVTINDTKPIYFYCSYDAHCVGGMVGVINGDMKDWKAYESAAIKVKTSAVGTPMGGATGGELEDADSMSGGSGGGDGDGDGDDDDDGGSGSMPSGGGGGGGGGGNDATTSSAPLGLVAFAAAAMAAFVF